MAKTAIVTGGSRGIGRSIVEKLLADGFDLSINYLTNSKDAEELVEIARKLGRKAIAVKADVSVKSQVEDLFEHTINEFGGVDVLVNNAGILTYSRISEAQEADFDRLFAINVKGTFFGCQQAALKLREGGSIINLSSSVTAMRLPTYGLYSATKGAVEQLTRVLAVELGPKKIRVNCISPGPTDTELFNTGKTEEQIQRMVSLTPLGRLGESSDISEVVSFLAGDGSKWITGQNIRANGGIS
jgi:3-oxoacyl-[acyl-carrier protein] reductase